MCIPTGTQSYTYTHAYTNPLLQMFKKKKKIQKEKKWIKLWKIYQVENIDWWYTYLDLLFVEYLSHLCDDSLSLWW